MGITPGLWRVNIRRDHTEWGGWDIYVEGPFVERKSGWGHIAKCFYYGKEQLEEAKANARAIAKIPKMIDLLRLALVFEDLCYEREYDDFADEFLPQVRALLEEIDGNGKEDSCSR